MNDNGQTVTDDEAVQAAVHWGMERYNDADLSSMPSLLLARLICSEHSGNAARAWLWPLRPSKKRWISTSRYWVDARWLTR